MIVKIVVIAIALILLIMLIKNDFKCGATLLSVTGCLFIFSTVAKMVSEIADGFEQIALSKEINSECVEIIIKILAVSYVAGFGADVCADAGEKAIANAVDCIGKVTMITLAFPMVTSIFESITDMIG